MSGTSFAAVVTMILSRRKQSTLNGYLETLIFIKRTLPFVTRVTVQNNFFLNGVTVWTVLWYGWPTLPVQEKTSVLT
jgi:hypothetical protein